MINATPTTRANAKKLISDGAHWESREGEILVFVNLGALVVEAPFSAADQRRCACDVAERLIDACDAPTSEVLHRAIATSRSYADGGAFVERARARDELTELFWGVREQDRGAVSAVGAAVDGDLSRAERYAFNAVSDRRERRSKRQRQRACHLEYRLREAS